MEQVLFVLEDSHGRLVLNVMQEFIRVGDEVSETQLRDLGGSQQRWRCLFWDLLDAGLIYSCGQAHRFVSTLVLQGAEHYVISRTNRTCNEP